jgi:hypothetical protein
MMPPTGARPHPVDLLLCFHHYRASRAALAAGAVVFDETGAIVEPDASGRATTSVGGASVTSRR